MGLQSAVEGIVFHKCSPCSLCIKCSWCLLGLNFDNWNYNVIKPKILLFFATLYLPVIYGTLLNCESSRLLFTGQVFLFQNPITFSCCNNLLVIYGTGQNWIIFPCCYIALSCKYDCLPNSHSIPWLLYFAGHTHGGQMFPLMLGAYLLNPFYAGLYRHGDQAHVYVSMGTRFWGFPVRFGTSSEISHITLVST